MKELINKKYMPHITLCAMVFLSCLGILIGNGVYPFGDNSLLHIDMYHQYCPFFSEFLSKLKSGDSLLYTWNLGMGSDYVSLYVYYLASPFNWLLIFWPKSLVIEFMEATIILKMILAALGFFLFAKKLYPVTGKDNKVHGGLLLPPVLCAYTYAFCGFVAAYNWDVMWMDCIALFPFIMLGLYELVNERKVLLYYISLALSIWANYYISIMICMFLCLYFVYLWVKAEEGRGQALLRFAWYSLLAGGTSAMLLLPEMYVLGYSGSQGINFPKTAEWYFNLIEELSRNNAFAYVYTGRNHWPNLYSGAFTILLVVLYFFNRRINWKEKAVRLLLLAFFYVSFANNYLDFIWHGFHFPDSLPGRQSFIYSFVVLCMALACMRKWRGNRNSHILTAILMIGIVLVFGGISTDSEVTDWFSFVITGVFVAAYATLFFLVKYSDKTGRRFYRNLAFVFAVVEVVANMAATGFGTTNRVDYTAKYTDYEALLSRLEEREGENSFYRVEDLERHTKNDDSYYGYASCTQFSSLMNINVSHFFQKVGMEGGKNFYCYNGATPALTSMLSVKYMLSDDTICQGDLWELVDQEGNANLYEYQYALPLGFMIDDSVMQDWDPSSSDDVANINELGYLLGAKSDLLTLMTVDSSVQVGTTDFSIIDPGYYYGVYQSCSAETLTLRKTNETRSYAKASHKYILDLGYCKMGEEMSVTNGKREFLPLDFYKLNMTALEDVYKTLSQQTMELTAKKSDYLEGSIQVDKEGYLLLSVTSEPGWTLYVDGEKADYEDFQDTFIAVKLSQGNHKIKLSYMTPGLEKGMLISGLCLVLFLISLVIRSIRKKFTPASQEVGPYNDEEAIEEADLAFVEMEHK